MHVTVNIPDELAAQVQARGMTPESFVNELIQGASRAAGSESPSSPSSSDLQAFFRAMAAHTKKIPSLPIQAFTRESFYQDHD